jgi:uncharacterized membrane protein YecN with MAPEG domain
MPAVDPLLFPVTGFYAALLGLMLVGLSVRTIRARVQKNIAIGDGNDPELRRFVRAHGNFTEYVPIALILIGIVEVNEAPVWAVHALGAVLLFGRVVHAYSLYAGIIRARVVGMAATFGIIVATALWNLARSLGLA